MKKLGERNFEIILRGLEMGSYDPDEIFYLFEERLRINEADEIHAFLTWCHKEGKGFGHGNYEERFAEFKEAA
jgi:hypothetical protein